MWKICTIKMTRLLKETEEDTNRKTSHAHGSEELTLVKYTYYQTHLQNQYNLHQNTKSVLHKIEETILNACGIMKNTEYWKQFWEKRTNLEVSRFQTILQSHNVKNSSVLAQNRHRHQWRRQPRVKSQYIQSTDPWQGSQEPKAEKTVSSTNGAGKTRETHAEHWNWTSNSYSSQKLTQNISKTSVRSNTICFTDENVVKKKSSLTLALAMIFLDMSSRIQQKKKISRLHRTQERLYSKKRKKIQNGRKILQLYIG